MSQGTSNLPPSRSWRDIRQGVSARAMSRAGRQRKAWAGVKAAVVGLLILGGCGGALVLYLMWEHEPAKLKEPVRMAPLRQVVFSTDGVLDPAWMGRALALPPKPTLMGLDLDALEQRLLASGQVQSVVLHRRFRDNTLVVTVRERTPVARLMVQEGAARPRMWLVARDGVIYEGAGYDQAELGRLPWLGGIALQRTARHGFRPIAGMDRVADLLSAARGLVPLLYANWEVVSLARLASDREILVRSRDIPEIVFDARGDFPRQLAKLDYIVATLRQQGGPPMARVDFSVGSQVPVELQESLSTAPAATSLPRTTSRSATTRDF